MFYRAMLYAGGGNATATRMSVCLSVRDVDVSWSHRLEIFKNIHGQLAGDVRSLQTTTSRTYSKGNTLKFWPKVIHPLLNWASQIFDGKLRRNSHSGERIGNYYSSFQWYDRWPSIYDLPLPSKWGCQMHHSWYVALLNGHISATGNLQWC